MNSFQEMASAQVARREPVVSENSAARVWWQNHPVKLEQQALGDI
jgi:hypothetical protein